MRITDNLKDDLADAPNWFLEALKIKPSELLIKNMEGDLSYSRWDCPNKNKNL